MLFVTLTLLARGGCAVHWPFCRFTSLTEKSPRNGEQGAVDQPIRPNGPLLTSIRTTKTCRTSFSTWLLILAKKSGRWLRNLLRDPGAVTPEPLPSRQTNFWWCSSAGIYIPPRPRTHIGSSSTPRKTPRHPWPCFPLTLERSYPRRKLAGRTSDRRPASPTMALPISSSSDSFCRNIAQAGAGMAGKETSGDRRQNIRPQVLTQ